MSARVGDSLAQSARGPEQRTHLEDWRRSATSALLKQSGRLIIEHSTPCLSDSSDNRWLTSKSCTLPLLPFPCLLFSLLLCSVSFFRALELTSCLSFARGFARFSAPDSRYRICEPATFLLFFQKIENIKTVQDTLFRRKKFDCGIFSLAK